MDQPQDSTTTTEFVCKRFDTGWLCRGDCTNPDHDEFLQDQN